LHGALAGQGFLQAVQGGTAAHEMFGIVKQGGGRRAPHEDGFLQHQARCEHVRMKAAALLFSTK
jgi:hypothetical protein